MYIIYESLPSTDTRTALIERIDHYWFHDVGYINPVQIQQVNLMAINAVEIPEYVAKASRFAKINWIANNGGIKFRVADGVGKDLMLDTSLDDSDPRKKVMYTLTETDEKNTVEFLKAVMMLELNNHYRQLTESERAKFPNKKALVLQEIKNCQTVLDAHRVMHCRFGTECHNHQRDEEELGSPEWDLSTPGLEIRAGIRRAVERSTNINPQ